MKNIRIVPRLDIKGPHVVKGIHLEGLRVLGDPQRFARYYYEQGADELIFQDVVASLYERNSLHSIISETAKEIFIPLTVGGGLRTIEDIRSVLRAGADKVSLNTAAIKNPQIISDAARCFGSSTIVITIEAIRDAAGKYTAYCDNGRQHTGLDAIEWACRAAELGAGELVVTSVDREGTGKGFDVELIATISERVDIPVIAHGGAGKVDDVVTVVKNGRADAVAVASILHYDYVYTTGDFTAHTCDGNTQYLQNIRRSDSFRPATINQIKEALVANGLSTRPTVGSRLISAAALSTKECADSARSVTACAGAADVVAGQD
jgi:cyclase